MAGRFVLRLGDIEGVLKSAPVAAMTHGAAERVASAVRSQGLVVSSGAELPVVVNDYVTDRAASAVVLAHPAGIAMQAKHGALTNAASSVGLEVKTYYTTQAGKRRTASAAQIANWTRGS